MQRISRRQQTEPSDHPLGKKTVHQLAAGVLLGRSTTCQRTKAAPMTTRMKRDTTAVLRDLQLEVSQQLSLDLGSLALLQEAATAQRKGITNTMDITNPTINDASRWARKEGDSPEDTATMSQYTRQCPNTRYDTATMSQYTRQCPNTRYDTATMSQ
eukprot:Polyplicarium_translucidae@DN3294_c3_g2_i3.p1